MCGALRGTAETKALTSDPVDVKVNKGTSQTSISKRPMGRLRGASDIVVGRGLAKKAELHYMQARVKPGGGKDKKIHISESAM